MNRSDRSGACIYGMYDMCFSRSLNCAVLLVRGCQRTTIPLHSNESMGLVWHDTDTSVCTSWRTQDIHPRRDSHTDSIATSRCHVCFVLTQVTPSRGLGVRGALMRVYILILHIGLGVGSPLYNAPWVYGHDPGAPIMGPWP